MKRILTLTFLMLAILLSYGQNVPATRPVVKSIIHLAQASPPLTPFVGEKYLSTNGLYYRWTGSQWILDVTVTASDPNWNDLINVPADIADGDDDTQLSQAQVGIFATAEGFIKTYVPTGNEPAYDAWDKNAGDDFDGTWASLTGIPADIADGDDVGTGGGSADANPEYYYVSRTTGQAVTNEWAQVTGQEDKKTMNYNASDQVVFHNITNTFSSTRAVDYEVYNEDTAAVFTSDTYSLRGNGTEPIETTAGGSMGIIGFYVDSVNAPARFRRAPGPLINQVKVDGFFKPYSISQVTGLSSSNVQDTSYTISWDAATASVGTIANYDLSIDGAAPIRITGATSYTVTGATANTSYNINVRAIDLGTNTGPYSANFSVTTNGSDPIAAMDGIVAYFSEDDLPAIGQAAGNWTDRINGYIMVAKGDPQVESSGDGGKEIQYDGSGDGHSNDADDAVFDPIPGTNAFSYAFRVGSDVGFNDEIVTKKNVGSSSYQLGVIHRGSDFRVRVGNTSYDAIGATVAANDIVTVTASTTTISLYVNAVFQESFPLTGTGVKTEVLAFACANGAGDFSQTSIRSFTFFQKALNQTEVDTIQSNL